MKLASHTRYIAIIVIGLGILGSFVGTSWSLENAVYKNLSTDQLVKMMPNKDFTLINVHVPYAGEIPQNDLTIPFDAIEQFKSELPSDKDSKIVAYCVGGHMGRIAAEKLVSMGYTQVFNLQGGMMGWKQYGKEILNKSK